MNELVKLRAPVIPAEQDYLDAFADSVGHGFHGPRLKFVKGTWQIDDEEVAAEAEFIVDITTFSRTFERWENKKPVEYIVEAAGTPRLPLREEISHTNKDLWPRDEKDGTPKDPWQLVYYAGLRRVGDDELIMFSSSSYGGKAELAHLAKYSKKHPGYWPRVRLSKDDYKHTTYGKIFTPRLEIVGLVPAVVEVEEPIDEPKEITAEIEAAQGGDGPFGGPDDPDSRLPV